VTRSATPVWIRLVALAGIGAAILLAAGCDSSGSKRDSLYQKLVGTWRIDHQIDLDRNMVTLEDTVYVEFLQREGDRAYRIIRAASNDTTGQGQLHVPRSNVLRMTSGPGGLLVWNFEFGGSQSVRFQLVRQADDDASVQDFLTAIGLSGGAESLAFELLRDSE
jgi:hypothetical protein